MAGEVLLVTQHNSADKWAFVNEADILHALELTYSRVDHVVEKIDRDVYVVKVSIEDVVNADVFTVQRVRYWSSRHCSLCVSHKIGDRKVEITKKI
jgi:hypothetical protein